MAGKLVKHMAWNLVMDHIKIYTKKVAMNVVNKIKDRLPFIKKTRKQSPIKPTFEFAFKQHLLDLTCITWNAWERNILLDEEKMKLTFQQLNPKLEELNPKLEVIFDSDHIDVLSLQYHDKHYTDSKFKTQYNFNENSLQLTGKYNFNIFEIGALLQFEPWPILGGSFIMSHQCLHAAAMVNPRGIILKAGCKIGKDLKFTLKGKHSSRHETSKMAFEIEGKHFENGVFNISIDTHGVLKGQFGGIKINDEEAPFIYAKLNFLEKSMKFGMKVKVTG